MKPPLLLLLCAAALAAGFPLGRALTPTTAAAVSPSAAASETVLNKPAAADKERAVRRDSGRIAELMAASSRGGSDGLMASLRASRLDPVLRACLLDTWRHKDPERLLRALAASASDLIEPDEDQRLANEAGALAESLAGTDPEAAMRVVRSFEGKRIHTHLLGAVVMSLFHHDTAKALEIAAKYPGVRFHGNLDYDKIHITAEQIPEIWKFARSGSLADLLVDALNDNFPLPRAMDEVAKEDGFTASRVASQIARNFAGKDLEAAKAYAVSAESFVTRNAVRLAVGERLAHKDPAAAAEWADQYLSAHYKNRVLKQAADTLQKTDPAAAEALRARLPQW